MIAFSAPHFEQSVGEELLIPIDLLCFDGLEEAQVMWFFFEDSRQLVLNILVVFNFQQQEFYVFFSSVTHFPLAFAFSQIIDVKSFHQIVYFLRSLFQFKILFQLVDGLLLPDAKNIEIQIVCCFAICLPFLIFLDGHSIFGAEEHL